MRQHLVAGFLPGAMLVALLTVCVISERLHFVPENIEAARPIVSLLEAERVTASAVGRASHYEFRRSVSTSIRTDRGYVIVIQFESDDAARVAAGEARSLCCAPFYVAMRGRQIVLTHDPALARLIEQVLPSA